MLETILVYICINGDKNIIAIGPVVVEYATPNYN